MPNNGATSEPRATPVMEQINVAATSIARVVCPKGPSDAFKEHDKDDDDDGDEDAPLRGGVALGYRTRHALDENNNSVVVVAAAVVVSPKFIGCHHCLGKTHRTIDCPRLQKMLGNA
ncbi:Aste57867_13250 [Aphanomyces stellatus]|uniref:Aste57867_13250 protein n=1 Tax=Aphanomyces stellatus TaxID=120398 RepID=A0A485KZC2_9STRA|nr:hypothetical protein As57867_013201 [Aphanomyces stellatus]VFT90090.1 Aste57867_13250 [Aphanomyces stellatus]